MRRNLVAMLVGVSLSSCGDGGSGGGGVAVVTGSPPSTPTPTPAATYSTYAQLTGDQTFKTACAAERYDYSPPLPVPVTAFGSGLTLGYTASTQTYLLTPDPQDSGLFGTQPRSYAPADHDPAAPATTLTYTRTTNGFAERFTIGSNSANGSSPDYVRGFFLRVPLYGMTTANSPAAQYFCIFGVPTRTDDLPAVAFAYSRGGLNGSALNYPPGAAPESYAVSQSQVSVSVDFTTNRLTTTIHVIGQLVTAAGVSTTTTDLGTYAGTATIDRSGHYSGVLLSADRSVQNTSFGGWFFGPQAAEAAFSLGFDALDPVTGQHVIFIGNALALK